MHQKERSVTATICLCPLRHIYTPQGLQDAEFPCLPSQALITPSSHTGGPAATLISQPLQLVTEILLESLSAMDTNVRLQSAPLASSSASFPALPVGVCFSPNLVLPGGVSQDPLLPLHLPLLHHLPAYRHWL